MIPPMMIPAKAFLSRVKYPMRSTGMAEFYSSRRFGSSPIITVHCSKSSSSSGSLRIRSNSTPSAWNATIDCRRNCESGETRPARF